MREASGSRYRRSRQRERILALLRETNTHPTAYWLHARLRKELPGLSMGTVYRNLTVLSEQGLISKIDFGADFERFDARTGHHYHFICDSCGTILDLDLPIDESLNLRVRTASGLDVRRHDIQFRGTCDVCAGKK